MSIDKIVYAAGIEAVQGAYRQNIIGLLSNWDGPSKPQLIGGFVLTIGGSSYIINGNTDIIGSPENGNVFIEVTPEPGGLTATASFIASKSSYVWSEGNAGWYYNNSYLLPFRISKIDDSWDKFIYMNYRNLSNYQNYQNVYINYASITDLNVPSTASIETCIINRTVAKRISLNIFIHDEVERAYSDWYYLFDGYLTDYTGILIMINGSIAKRTIVSTEPYSFYMTTYILTGVKRINENTIEMYGLKISIGETDITQTWILQPSVGNNLSLAASVWF